MPHPALRWLTPSDVEPLLADLSRLGDRTAPLVLHDVGQESLVRPAVGGLVAASDLVRSSWGRAQQLGPLVAPGHVVCLTSAVWVHTGSGRPGSVRTYAAARGTTLLIGGGADVVSFGEVRVTGPLRTACDVATLEPLDVAAGALLALGRDVVDLADVADALAAQRRRPHVRRARRLVDVLRQASTVRVDPVTR